MVAFRRQLQDLFVHQTHFYFVCWHGQSRSRETAGKQTIFWLQNASRTIKQKILDGPQTRESCGGMPFNSLSHYATFTRRLQAFRLSVHGADLRVGCWISAEIVWKNNSQWNQNVVSWSAFYGTTLLSGSSRFIQARFGVVRRMHQLLLSCLFSYLGFTASLFSNKAQSLPQSLLKYLLSFFTLGIGPPT